ncbi:DNA-directed RNA polymerase [Candidatus Pacearchaeota archaeon]|nr:DNA-directed RNA polymerase [Candidatus Pacearchaeota archaeon]
MERQFGGERRSFGGPRRFGGGQRRFNSGPREMHKAVCSECKQECEVPFKPTEGRPVLCLNCFKKKRESEGGGFHRNNRDSDH